MEDRKSLVSRINRDSLEQIGRFLISGIAGVVCDFVTYRTLLNLRTNVSVAKPAGFIAGTIVVFILHKFWTYQTQRKSLLEVARFVLLYAFTLWLNTLTNNLVLGIWPGFITIAFLFATGVTTVANFIGTKFFVFTRRAQSPEEIV